MKLYAIDCIRQSDPHFLEECSRSRMRERIFERLRENACKSLTQKDKQSITSVEYQKHNTQINRKFLSQFGSILEESIQRRRMISVQHQMSLNLGIHAVKCKKAYPHNAKAYKQRLIIITKSLEPLFHTKAIFISCCHR